MRGGDAARRFCPLVGVGVLDAPLSEVKIFEFCLSPLPPSLGAFILLYFPPLEKGFSRRQLCHGRRWDGRCCRTTPHGCHAGKSPFNLE